MSASIASQHQAHLHRYTGPADYDAAFFDAQREESLRSARVVVPLLLNVIQPRSVVDFGCGVGAWLRAFEENGVTEFMGYDGDYVDRDRLLIPRERFCVTDLAASP